MLIFAREGDEAFLSGRVVWCDVVPRGVVWCRVVWCLVVWCHVVWCRVVWCCVVWCRAVPRRVMPCDVVWRWSLWLIICAAMAVLAASWSRVATVGASSSSACTLMRSRARRRGSLT